MIIPSQLPQYVAATRSGALQALALQAGQILSGEVIGPAPNGGTQVQISGQLLNLLLPQAAKAGETLKFEVQGSGAQLRLSLQAGATQPTVALNANPPAAAAPPASQLTLGPDATAAQAAGVTQPPQSAPAAPGSPVSPAATPRAAPTSAPPAQAPPANTALPPASATAGAASPAPVASAAQPASAPTAQIAANPAAANPAASAGSAPPAVAAATGQAASVVVPRPVAPYASAAPAVAVPPTVATAAAAPVAAGLPAASSPVAAAPIVAASITPVLASTPETALAQMVQTALPQQNTIASLVSALTSIAGKIALPEPVVRAAQQVLANRVVLDGGKLDGAGLQKAIMNSGVFQEAALVRAGTPLLAPQADMKAALLALRQSLSTWLGQQPQLLASIAQVAPPLRGKIPRVPVLDVAPIDPAASVEETGKHLLDRTEAALARTRLHQHASLPDPHVNKGADLSTDLPVIIGGQQSLLQLQIHRDQHNGTETTGERGWQMRFAINLPGMGEVGAQVSLRGSATGIMLWAAEQETSDALAADIEGLRASLSAAGLSPGALIVRHGAPVEAPQPANSGHLVDSRR